MRRNLIVEAVTALGHEGIPKYKAADAVRNFFCELGNNRATVRMANQDEITEFLAYDLFDQIVDLLAMVHSLFDTVAMSQHGRRNGNVAF